MDNMRILLFILVSISQSVYCNNIDSLKTIYNTSEGVDRLMSGLEISNLYIYKDLDSSLLYSDKMIELAHSLGQDVVRDNISRAYWNKGMAYHGLSNFDSSTLYYGLAEVSSRDVNKDTYLQVKTNHIALRSQHNVDVVDDINVFLSELDTTDISQLEMYFWGVYLKSRGYENQGNYQAATSNLLTLLDFSNQEIRKKHLGGVYQSLGIFNSKLKNFNIAKNFFKLSLQHEIGNFNDSITVMINLAEMHKYLYEIDTALYILEAIPYDDILLDDKFLYSKLMFDIYARGDEKSMMDKYIQEMAKIESQINHKFSTYILAQRQAIVANRDGDYQKAKKHLSTMEKLMKENNFYSIIDKVNYQTLKLLQHLQEVGSISGYDNFKYYIKLRDSLDIEISNNVVNEQNTLYQTEKKQIENQKLKLEKQVQDAVIISQYRALLAGGAGLLLISILSLVLYRQREKQRKLNQEVSRQKDQILTLNQELNHRVKNNLAFMTSLLEMQARRTDSKEAKQLLLESESRLKALALVHTQLFKNDGDVAINLKDYLSQITSNLQDLFEMPNKTLDLKTAYTDYTINAEDAMRIGLIINELVTNSVKHAFSDIANPEIFITTSLNSDQQLVVDYKDNGPGISTTLEGDIETNSMGAKLIELLKRQLGDGYVVMV